MPPERTCCVGSHPCRSYRKTSSNGWAWELLSTGSLKFRHLKSAGANGEHVVFEISGVFTPSLIPLVQEPHRHAQAGRGLWPCDALLRDVHRMEAHPLAGACDVQEHLVFPRI